MPEYFIDFLFERWIPFQASTSVLYLHYRPETVNCSTKDVYTSEITFLALQSLGQITEKYLSDRHGHRSEVVFGLFDFSHVRGRRAFISTALVWLNA